MDKNNTLFTQLNNIIKPVNESFWQELLNNVFYKKLSEEAGVAGGVAPAAGMAALGPAPTPTMGQAAKGAAATVNGVPVPSQSIKKKKKTKKDENLNPQSDKAIELRAILTKAQAEEHDAITSYLEKAKQCDDLGFDELGKLFKELASDETVHTGCIQAALDKYNISDLENVIDGVAEAEELLYTESINVVDDNIEEMINQLLQEDFHEEYEEITNALAKQLDRMAFEFANTEEIIYKKEGQYKYLLKFDNKNGYLKFKISKDDDVIEVREWQLDKGQDITPIFKEIEDLYNKYDI